MLLIYILFLFFFKHKTAYEMRISDWSSDVCSSDLKSRLLAPLKNATVVAAPEEIAFFESRVDIPELMHEATNNLLDGARRFDPAIENLDDLNEHLVRHPAHDAALCRILKVSGYLEIWQIEQAKNPWTYDIKLMHRDRK